MGGEEVIKLAWVAASIIIVAALALVRLVSTVHGMRAGYAVGWEDGSHHRRILRKWHTAVINQKVEYRRMWWDGELIAGAEHGKH
jgi:hypothetical protein